MRPVIGLSAYREPAQWGAWRSDADLLPCSYTDSVAGAGGAPLLLPPIPGIEEELMGRVDALVITGGPDVDSALYGSEPHDLNDSPRRQRDQAESTYLAIALERDIPVLAICRGLQLLNVFRGGSLIQHLPDRPGTRRHAPAGQGFVRHGVEFKVNSRLAAITSAGGLEVDSHHHQGVDRIGDGLVATAWADDGVIEALEDPDRNYLVGVQWHPEAGDDLALFRALIDAASCVNTQGSRS